MTELVVQLLEMVQIEEKQRRGRAGLLEVGECLFQPALESTSIEQPRQRVVLCLPALQRLLLATLSDVLHDPDQAQRVPPLRQHDHPCMNVQPQRFMVAAHEP